MPMEIFVSCVGDLATAGGLVVVVTLVRSPPGSSSFLSARPWGLESFTLAVSLRSGRVEFLRGCELNRTHKGNACYLSTFSAAA